MTKAEKEKAIQDFLNEFTEAFELKFPNSEADHVSVALFITTDELKLANAKGCKGCLAESVMAYLSEISVKQPVQPPMFFSGTNPKDVN